MPIFYKDNKIIHFVHIPKTGGTSIEKLFKNDNYRIILLNQQTSIFFPCSPQHFHSEINKYIKLEDIDYSFAVVRSPLERLVSEYFFREFSKEGVSFDFFVKMTFLLYRFNKYIFDNHIRPQAEFIHEGVDIFRFEDGFDNIRKSLHLNGLLNINKEIPYLLKSKKKAITISNATLNKIYSFYHVDYENFEYKKIWSGETKACSIFSDFISLIKFSIASIKIKKTK